jgi:N-methylhydantoinase B
MFGTGQGGGARATKDGFDVSNIAGSTNTSIPNIEDIEGRYPILYLNRHMVTDSGGPGKFRGGVSISYSNVPYETGDVRVTVGYVGKSVAAEGLEGGKPGITSEIRIKRNSNVKDLLTQRTPTFEAIQGEEEVPPQTTGQTVQREKDVICFRAQGGGGYGNPMERDPESVRRDVKEMYVSLEKAKSEYGVVMSGDMFEIDLETTERWRNR